MKTYSIEEVKTLLAKQREVCAEVFIVGKTLQDLGYKSNDEEAENQNLAIAIEDAPEPEELLTKEV